MKKPLSILASATLLASLTSAPALAADSGKNEDMQMQKTGKMQSGDMKKDAMKSDDMNKGPMKHDDNMNPGDGMNKDGMKKDSEMKKDKGMGKTM